jgi:hypothetical protein
MLALGHTQPSVQWVLQFLYRGLKRLGRGVDLPSQHNAEVKIEQSHTSAIPRAPSGKLRSNLYLYNTHYKQRDVSNVMLL